RWQRRSTHRWRADPIRNPYQESLRKRSRRSPAARARVKSGANRDRSTRPSLDFAAFEDVVETAHAIPAVRVRLQQNLMLPGDVRRSEEHTSELQSPDQ